MLQVAAMLCRFLNKYTYVCYTFPYLGEVLHLKPGYLGLVVFIALLLILIK